MIRNRRYFGLEGLRTADRQLLPALITCPCSACLLLVGVPIFLFAIIWKTMSSPDGSPGSRTTGTALLVVSSVMISLALVLMVFAIVCYKRYDKRRRNIMRNAEGGYVISPPVPPNRDPQTANLINEQQPYASYPQSPASLPADNTTDSSALSPSSEKEC